MIELARQPFQFLFICGEFREKVGRQLFMKIYRFPQLRVADR